MEEHIRDGITVGRTISEGIDFKAKDAFKFRMEIAFAGSEKIIADLNFYVGTAVVPPIIQNSKEIHALVRTIPVPKSGVI